MTLACWTCTQGLSAAQLPCCQAVLAAGGRQALQIMEHLRPDLVLLDLMMPDMDGFEVMAAMQGHPQLRNVPVIVLTAQDLLSHDMAKLHDGVAAVLGKGLFSTDEVIAQVEVLLGRSQRLGGDAPAPCARRWPTSTNTMPRPSRGSGSLCGRG